MFKNTLISFHERTYLGALYSMLENYKELKERSVDYLYYQILDMITDHHLDVIDISAQLEEFESDILESRKLNQEEFYQIRKKLFKD